MEYSDKSRLAAALFAWFLGIFGAHRFYVGKTGSAVAMLLLTLTMVGMAATFIWAIVDFILILTGSFTDKEGKLVRKWTD